jgi:HSP20 family protein
MFMKTSLVPWRGGFGLRHGAREETHPVDVFHREFDRLFDEFWRGFDLPMLGGYEMPYGAMTPRMDVTEDEDHFLVLMELPGMVLTIKGEKKVETEETGKPHTYMERSYGSFRRSIPLDLEVVTDKVEATFDKGVLTITLPKTAEAKKTYKKIPIHVSGKVKKLEKKAA